MNNAATVTTLARFTTPATTVRSLSKDSCRCIVDHMSPDMFVASCIAPETQRGPPLEDGFGKPRLEGLDTSLMSSKCNEL